MPRRPTRTYAHLPLFLVTNVLSHEVRTHGGEVEWMEARRTQGHYYTVRVRTRPVNREFRGGRAKRTTGTAGRKE